jgi:hypothetical protein
MIVKICKVHGKLKKDECYLHTKGYYACKTCRKEYDAIYRGNRENNYESSKIYDDFNKILYLFDIFFKVSDSLVRRL